MLTMEMEKITVIQRDVCWMLKLVWQGRYLVVNNLYKNVKVHTLRIMFVVMVENLMKRENLLNTLGTKIRKTLL